MGTVPNLGENKAGRPSRPWTSGFPALRRIGALDQRPSGRPVVRPKKPFMDWSPARTVAAPVAAAYSGRPRSRMNVDRRYSRMGTSA